MEAADGEGWTGGGGRPRERERERVRREGGGGDVWERERMKREGGGGKRGTEGGGGGGGERDRMRREGGGSTHMRWRLEFGWVSGILTWHAPSPAPCAPLNILRYLVDYVHDIETILD